MSIDAISSDVPCAERNLIRLNAPPIATPAPILPFTKVITAATMNGISDTTIKNLFVERTLNDIKNAYINPDTIATAAIVKNSDVVTDEE